MKKKGSHPRGEQPADELFRAAVEDITPLAPRNKARVETARPRPVPRRLTPRDRESIDALSDHLPADLASATGEALRFARPGVQRQALRQLARGGSIVEDELDLHGLTVAEAKPLLVGFLDRCVLRGVRYVRVIHGKGLRSAQRGGVLKTRVAAWLVQRDDVLAYTEARPRDGGSGAMLVMLRTLR